VTAVAGNAEDVASSYHTLISHWAHGIADAIRDNPRILHRRLEPTTISAAPQ